MTPVPEVVEPSQVAPPATPSDFNAENLRGKSVRGALATGVAQAAALVLRTGSTVLLARLVSPRDFGLFGMVAAFTGVLSLFRDFGLSLASVTNVTVTREQLSTLFWVNLALGMVLAGLCAAGAPALVHFYGEPRLLLIAIALGTSFLFNGAAAQHRAILQRAMRFSALAASDTCALILSVAAAVAFGAAGFGYWALVVMTVAPVALGAVGAWLITGWMPGWPSRVSGIRSMLLYGGTVTLNSLVVYIAYNADNVLVGRFWGAEALGVYGRAYTLINIPTDSLNSAVGNVAFPALARVRNDPERLRRYFLRGYSLFLAAALPIMASCGLFSEDIIRVFLGPKWTEAAAIFRLLTPVTFAFAVVNPLGWLMMATGYSGRSLKIAFMICPVVIAGYSLGIGAGPRAVAAGFSIAMVALIIPIVLWATHQTFISAKDIAAQVVRPALAVATGVVVAFASTTYISKVEPVFLRLVAESAVLWGTYLVCLLFAMNQKQVYVELARDLGLWRTRTEKTSNVLDRTIAGA